jgi:hypothetical protein
MDGVAEFPNFPAMRQYTDETGVRWARRGDTLDGKTLAKRVRSLDVQVVHHYLGVLTQIAPADREKFWEEAVRKMQESVQSDFVGVEFKNGEGRHLLVVDERC